MFLLDEGTWIDLGDETVDRIWSVRVRQSRLGVFIARAVDEIINLNELPNVVFEVISFLFLKLDYLPLQLFLDPFLLHVLWRSND